jgi:cyclophilin family peptidyl-prolyl cis-trans isomerase
MRKLLPLLALLGIAAGARADDLPAGSPNGLYAIFNTSKGVFIAKLYEKYTPIAVSNFVGLATGTKAWKDPVTGAMVHRPMYDNIIFHRILRDMMIQSGDPTGTGRHDCGFTIPDEFLIGLPFNKPGLLAVANTGAPDSGACQFFVTTGQVPEWNNKYTIFGEVTSGLPVVLEINKGHLIGDKPVTPERLISVRIQRVGPAPPVKAPKVKNKN